MLKIILEHHNFISIMIIVIIYSEQKSRNTPSDVTRGEFERKTTFQDGCCYLRLLQY